MPFGLYIEEWLDRWWEWSDPPRWGKADRIEHRVAAKRPKCHSQL